jgi:hypothetical protein
MLIRWMSIAAMLALSAGCAMSGSSPFVSPSEPHAILDFRRPPVSLTPARLAEIDGTNVNAPLTKSSFWVSPGEHEIVVIGGIDGSTTVSKPGGSGPKPNPGRVTISVDEGKRYFIGIQMISNRSDQWEPVIYKVEDI